ncbi:probable receptor-like protein kinase At5g20050 [Coffea eugenioides]|uniref:probable receptor-like protein kinase At5g20050 n=1 Tax=Coffea eugenioides TaxID=49369 RepID=UPI000F5C659A|nr:probable receptor-like protein kinase At5g20050 [Coffea arabica]XP_027176810.1 probable receptor-like protein kinase At5g20050 [Coffea eugenioides]
MEDRKAYIIAVSLVSVLTITIVVARISLKLSKTFFLVCGANIAAILAVFSFLVIRRRYNNRRKLLETQLVSEGRELRIEYSFLRKVAGVPTKFRYKELEEATDGFRALLGQGASASVFKGILNDGTPVAVKRIVGDDKGEKEFRSEVAAIASIQHVNLLRLLGYCSVPSGPRFLVYEFVYNGSLDNWIFPRRETHGRRGGCLSWDMRCRVALDVARALSYLHHDCRSCILHLDVKPENILLDESYRALVCDFGLSKLMGKEESRIVTTIRGTRGYLAPEWILENGVSEKCDVYGFGMVLLEIIGGRRSVCTIEDENERRKKKFECFAKIAIEKLREGKLMEIVDRRLVLAGGIDERQVKRLVCIALWCIQDKPKVRPSMGLVVEMLEGRVPVDEPPENTQFLIADLLSAEDGESTTPDRGRLFAAMDNAIIPSTAGYSFSISVLSGR